MDICNCGHPDEAHEQFTHGTEHDTVTSIPARLYINGCKVSGCKCERFAHHHFAGTPISEIKFGSNKMSEKVKRDLINRFTPEYCPNCGEHNGRYFTIELVQSSVPNWNVTCKLCGAGYSVRIFN